MINTGRHAVWTPLCVVLPAALIAALSDAAHAQFVPGSGTLFNSDDFEDGNWSYIPNLPKSSKEEDEQIRYPLGGSNNGRWMESPKRGAPDMVQRVATPAGGLEGSTGAMLLRSRDTGIPGRPGYKQVQDDFILTARPMGISYSPSYVVRVYLPPWEEWEQRTGVSFGIRAGMQGPTETWEEASFGKRLFGRRREKVTKVEPFYPGFFIHFNPKTAQNAEPHALILIRADGMGHDVTSKKITEAGWWTFGMSVTPDGRCHYYAHAGVADLTAADYLTSLLPYGIPAHYFNTIFFNVCSADNGQSWSTPWIIDDPKIFYGSGQSTQYAQQQGQFYRR